MKTTVLSKIFAAAFLAVAVLSCTPIGTDTSEEDEDKTECLSLKKVDSLQAK